MKSNALQLENVDLVKIFFAIGAILRIYYAWIADGFVYPDAIFQSREIAHYMVFGYGILPWEYQYVPETDLGAMRSIIHPLVYTIPLFIGKILSLNWTTVIKMCSLLSGMISIISLYSAHYFLKRFLPRRSLVLDLTFAMLAVSGYWIHIGNQSFSNVLYTPFLFWGMALFLEKRPKRLPKVHLDPLFHCGLVIGIGSLLRIDIFLYCGVFALLFYRSSIKRLPQELFRFVLGYIFTGIIFATLLDFTWYREFFLTHWRAFTFNIIHDLGTAFVQHERSWYEAQILEGELQQKLFFAFAMISMGAYLNLQKWQNVKLPRYFRPLRLRKQMKIIFFLIISLAAASCLKNQQLRFLYPWVPFLFLFFAIALADFIVVLHILLANLKFRFHILTPIAVVMVFFFNVLFNDYIYMSNTDPNFFQDMYEASTWVSQQEDLREALFKETALLAGGKFYFHTEKPVDFEPRDEQFITKLNAPTANYIIVPNYRGNQHISSELSHHNYELIKYVRNKTQVWKLRSKA